MAETAYRTAIPAYATASVVTSATLPPTNAPSEKPAAHARLK